MQSYKELRVWQMSMDLVVEIYRVTAFFPKDERFGLVSQMRRASVAIPSNIAEGFARKTKKDNANFITIAYASATEIETQMLISRKLRFVEPKEWEKAEEMLTSTLKMLYRYRQALYA